MIKKDDRIIMKAIALCYRPYLKTEESLIYTNLGRTQFALKASEYAVYKTPAGYYQKEDLDRMMLGIKQEPKDAKKGKQYQTDTIKRMG